LTFHAFKASLVVDGMQVHTRLTRITYEGVQKERITLCTFATANFFTRKRPEVPGFLEPANPEKARVTVNKNTNAGGSSRNEAKTRFAGQRFEHPYRGWRVGRITESNVRHDFGGSERRATVPFATQVLCRFAVPEQEPEAKGAEGKDYTMHLRLHLFLHPVAQAISLRRVGCRTQCKQESPWKKHRNGRERPHFLADDPPKGFVGSLPPECAAAAQHSAAGGHSDEQRRRKPY